MNNRYMVEELTNVWKQCGTKQLAKIFKEYAVSKGYTILKNSQRRSNHSCRIENTCGRWNRVGCYYYTDNIDYGNENLVITLRKKAGDYMIIERRNTRAFEVDSGGIRHYNEQLLKAIIDEHEDLFKALIAIKEVV